MTITVKAAGATTAAAAAVSPLAPGVPASLVATSLSVLVVELKGTAAGTAPTITTPTGWTIIGSVTNNGTLVAGTDTGSNTIGMYYRVGSYTGPSITTTGADSGGAGILALDTSLGGWDLSATTTGSDTTSGANGSITGAAGLDLVTGDWVIVGCGMSGDIGSITGATVAATGATIALQGGPTDNLSLAVTTGTDSRLLADHSLVTAGSSTAAPVFTWTNTSSTTGHARFVRIREVSTAAIPSRVGVSNPAINRASNW